VTGPRRVVHLDHSGGTPQGGPLRPIDPFAEEAGRGGRASKEKGSIATGSNLPFSEWGSIIPDPRLVAAIVDRLTFRAHIIETGTESYRLRTTRAAKTSKRKAG
jgi:hypothetical protein